MKLMSVHLLFASALLCVVSAATQADTPTPRNKREAAAAWTEDGLQKMTVKGLDVVYSRPGASLGGYQKILLRPISVAFRRGWEQEKLPGSNRRISAEDSQRIKDKLAALVREEVLKELAAGGYQLADNAGDDVLDVGMAIVDLQVNAPDVSGTSRVDFYAVSAGEMTLIAELRDSVSGEVVSRVFDHAEAHESLRPERITNVDNVAEARRAAAAWAKSLRAELDAAKGAGG